ncbi:hypothetical protein B0H13DRAFT_2689828 [Mycena leptocephala]|nr:hypothetical protein B0H13DRAFT_2689828 [Mycena leptocephala]
MALTPSRTGPRPRFRGSTLPPRALAASIASWELCRAADFPSFIINDALLGMLRALGVGGSPLGACSAPSLLRRGALVVEEAQVALLLLMREREQWDAFTSVKQLRPPPLRTCASRASRAPGDGGGDWGARRWRSDVD